MHALLQLRGEVEERRRHLVKPAGARGPLHGASIEIDDDGTGRRARAEGREEGGLAPNQVGCGAVNQKRRRLIGAHQVPREERDEDGRRLEGRDQSLEGARRAVEPMGVVRVQQHSLVGEHRREQIRGLSWLVPEGQEEWREGCGQPERVGRQPAELLLALHEHGRGALEQAREPWRGELRVGRGKPRPTGRRERRSRWPQLIATREDRMEHRAPQLIHGPAREQHQCTHADGLAVLAIAELQRRAMDARAVGLRQAEANIPGLVNEVGMHVRW